jgi:hypothetical protein
MTQITVSVNGKKHALKSNEEIDFKIENGESVRLEVGKYIWKKTITISDINEDIQLILKLNPEMSNPIPYLMKPSEYILYERVSLKELEAEKALYSDLSLVKKSTINFMDACTVAFGALIGFIALMRWQGPMDYNYLVLAITALAIWLSVAVRRFSLNVISLRSMMLRNLIFTSAALIWYLRFFEIPGLVLFAISLFGFFAFWRLSDNLEFVH